MKIKMTFLCAFTTLLMLAPCVRADVSLNGARVGAVDSPAVADFYKAAFGMQEVQRIQMGGGNVEIMLNFGATVAAAKANPNGDIVIMHRDSDALDDPVPHIVLNVTDITSTVAALKKAGGSMEREPFEFGNTGIMIGMAKDPAGNRIEMIQQAH